MRINKKLKNRIGIIFSLLFSFVICSHIGQNIISHKNNEKKELLETVKNQEIPEQLMGLTTKYEKEYFDINDQWNGDNQLKNTDIFMGSNMIEKNSEGSQMWLTQDAAITLKNSKKENFVHFKGYIPISIYKKMGKDSLTIRIILNDIEVFRETYIEDTVVDLWIDKEVHNINDKNLKICMKADNQLIAKEISDENDVRELSYLLESIKQENKQEMLE